MNSLYPWIMMLTIVPCQLFLVIYLPKRFRKEPFWAQAIISLIVLSQILLVYMNIISIWEYFS